MPQASSGVFATAFELPRRLIGPRAEFVAARWPFVWQTRLYLWAPAGIIATVLAIVVAARLDIRTESVATVDEITGALSGLTFLLYSVVLLIGVDVIRRAPGVPSPRQVAKFSGSVAAAVAIVLLPESVAMRVGLGRIAALESESDLAERLAFHRDHEFWGCREDGESLTRAIAEHRDRIERELRRYGFGTNFETSTGFCPGTSLALSMRRSGLDLSYDSAAPELLRARLLSVQAAQSYVRGDINPYDTGQAPAVARELFGAAAVAPPIPARAWQLSLIALAVGLLAGVIVATRFARAALVQTLRQWLAAVRTRVRSPAPLDRRLSMRWPTVWSARVHTSLPSLVALVLLTVVLATGSATGEQTIFFVLPMLVLVLFLALRAQEKVRHLSIDLTREIRVVVIHAAFVGGLFELIVLSTGTHGYDSLEGVTVVAVVALLTAGLFQAARMSTAVLAYVSALIAYLGLVAGFLMAQLLATTWQLSIAAAFVTALLIAALVVTLAVWITKRWDGRLLVRRIVLGAIVILAVPLGMVLPVLWVPNGAVTVGFTIAAVIGSIGTTALVLRLTEGERRRLSFSSR